MPIKETPGALGSAGYISGRAVEREQGYLARRAALRESARRGDSLTGVRARSLPTRVVHLGFDYGSYDSYPLCGRLANRHPETTDETANCDSCARVVRELGLEYLIKDKGGWTGLYEPRRR